MLKDSNILIQNEIVQHEQITADSTLARNTGFSLRTQFHKIVRLHSAKEYPLMLDHLSTMYPFLKLDLDALSKGSIL